MCPEQNAPDQGTPPGGQPPYGQPPGGQPPYGQPPGGQPPQGQRPRPEKQDEKEQEKRREKGEGLDEKYHRNPLGFVAWALVLIWLGVTLLLQNTDTIRDDDRGWAIFFWGGGGIFLMEALIRMAIPRFRRPLVGSLVWGAIWVGVGFGLWYKEWQVIGPLVIIAIGVGILIGRLMPRR